MLVKIVTYFGNFGYLNSFCLRKSIILMFLISSRHMFLTVSGRHVGAQLDGHQHGVTIQISINLGKKFLRISSVRKFAVT